MRLQTKLSADLLSGIQSSEDSMVYDRDEEELEGTSDHADSEEEDDEDMPQTAFHYLELFDELCGLFIAPRCLLIRSSYETLHNTLMTAAEGRGERLETVNCFRPSACLHLA